MPRITQIKSDPDGGFWARIEARDLEEGDIVTIVSDRDREYNERQLTDKLTNLVCTMMRDPDKTEEALKKAGLLF